MELAIVGLGKMGTALAQNFIEHDCKVTGYDLDESARAAARKHGIPVANTLEGSLDHMIERKVVWLMVPSGSPTDACVRSALDHMGPNDILIDGGNSFYRNSMRHAAEASERGVLFLDAGTSGGVSGAREGACIMVGGDREAWDYMEPALMSISVEGGCLYTGPAGSGHFMKMVHNGIEYGMMQALGEGMHIMKESEFNYDLAKVAHTWSHGSVIRGWLMELMEQQLIAHPGLSDIRGVVAANGEAKWTVETALNLEVPTPVIALALMVRNNSRIDNSFTCKAVAALRNGFGGHSMMPEGESS